MNGIEHLWGVMKFEFRKILTIQKVNMERIDILKVMRTVIRNVSKDKVLIKKIAMRGFKNILFDKRNPRMEIKEFQGHEFEW